MLHNICSGYVAQVSDPWPVDLLLEFLLLILFFFFLFFNDFKLLMFHNNIVKNFRNFEQAELVGNLHPTYLSVFAYFAAIFTLENNKNTVEPR